MSITPPPAPERFAFLLQLLQRAVAACHKDGLMAAPLIVLIWKRLADILRRFTRLADRIKAGTFKPRRPHTRKPPADPKPRPPSPFPEEFGWLIPLVPWVPMRQFWGGPARAALDQLLQDAEMQGLMAAAPAEMGRILRPLCWMLGLKPPPVLARPRRPAAAGAPEVPPVPAPPAPPPDAGPITVPTPGVPAPPDMSAPPRPGGPRRRA